MAYKINLTRKQEEKLRKIAHENQDNPHVLKRVYCILLRNEGQRNENTRKLLGVHEDTIADWLKIYTKKGLPGLLTFRFNRRRKSQLNQYRSKIKRLAGRKSIHTLEELQTEIKEKLGLDVEYSWLYRYCKKNGIYKILTGDL